MVTEIDVYRTANEYIKQYGENATVHAAMKVDEMLEKADFDGQSVWLRVIKAIDELQSEVVPDGDTRH